LILECAFWSAPFGARLWSAPAESSFCKDVDGALDQRYFEMK